MASGSSNVTVFFLPLLVVFGFVVVFFGALGLAGVFGLGGAFGLGVLAGVLAGVFLAVFLGGQGRRLGRWPKVTLASGWA